MGGFLPSSGHIGKRLETALCLRWQGLLSLETYTSVVYPQKVKTVLIYAREMGQRVSELESGQTTLETLFTNRAFRVPPYQRYFAWEERQLHEFIGDLSNITNNQKYFLGSLLFMRPNKGVESIQTGNSSESGVYKVFDVVDGQQRLTTAVLFMHSARTLRPALLRPMIIRNFLYDDEEHAYKFQTVQDDWPFFKSLLDGNGQKSQAQTPSQQRLQSAIDFFETEIAKVGDTEVSELIQKLCESVILVHAVNGYGEASMIFETVNDRGKRLTDLEALKSFLMRIVDLTKRSEIEEKQATIALQQNFAAIYRTINRFEGRWPPMQDAPEDNALRQCHLTFPRPTSDRRQPFWAGEGSAKDDIKSLLTQLYRNDQKKDDALDTSLGLAQHIRVSFEKLEALVNNSFGWPEIDRLLVLRRIANFWPVLITTFSYPNSAGEREFRQILQLCEIASLKIWGIGDFRADKAQQRLIGIAQQENGNRAGVVDKLIELMKDWDIPSRWLSGLNSRSFYLQRRDARYVLFEYENFLRAEKGYTLIPYSDFDSMTIEHIAAQKGAENVDNHLLNVAESDLVESTSEAAGEHPVSLIHHIGNLVIDPGRPNSGKNNLPVTGKLAWFNAAPYLSQLELEELLKENNEHWDAGVVKKRGLTLVAFALKRWNEGVI